MKKLCLLLAIACCVSLFGCAKPEQPPEPGSTGHIHTFGAWKLQENAACTHDGREDRHCSTCGFTESRPIPMLPHRLNDQNVCKDCRYVEFDKNAELAELGVLCDQWYTDNLTARFAWDIKVWDGKLHRGSGDYAKNSGKTMILTYDIATQRWAVTGECADEAIHGFVELGGTLCAPGIDATGSWGFGNYYALKDGKWEQLRNLPNAVHNFDMLECDGRIFAGLGTESVSDAVAVSEDGGKTFTLVPLYKNGKPYSPSKTQFSRAYELVKYNGQVYALVYLQTTTETEWQVFRYEDGKMHYVADGYKLAGGQTISRKCFGGEFEFDGACYIACGSLMRITDFSKTESWQKVPMPGKEAVVDILLRDGVIYVLATAQKRNPDTYDLESYRTVIYKSTTGQEGSFEEFLNFDYCATPICFDYDGTYFYIGTGAAMPAVQDKTGMVLRVKPKA